MQPKMADLACYKRFAEYFAAAMQQTNQMKSVCILYTNFEKGETKRISNRTMYLGVDFFRHCPKELPETHSKPDLKQVAMFDDNDDDFVKAGEEEVNDLWQEHTLDQVRIHYADISWLFNKDYGKEFIQQLVTNPDCFKLMELQSTREIFNFIWYECAHAIIMSTFVPYCALIVLPLTLMAILIGQIEDENQAYSYIFYYFSVFLFFLGIVNIGYKEGEEAIKNGMMKYFTDSRNLF